MQNLTIKVFEKELEELINKTPLSATVKELVVDRVHLKMIKLSEEEARREADMIINNPKGEEDGKED